MMPMSFLHKFSTWYFNRKALPYWAIVLADSLIILMAYAVTYLIFRPQILRWADFGLSAERLQLLGWTAYASSSSSHLISSVCASSRRMLTSFATLRSSICFVLWE